MLRSRHVSLHEWGPSRSSDSTQQLHLRKKKVLFTILSEFQAARWQLLPLPKTFGVSARSKFQLAPPTSEFLIQNYRHISHRVLAVLLHTTTSSCSSWPLPLPQFTFFLPSFVPPFWRVWVVASICPRGFAPPPKERENRGVRAPNIQPPPIPHSGIP